MSELENKVVVNEDEISLKDLILKFWEYFWHVLGQWKWIALFVFLGIALNLYRYFTHIPKFTATISFMINEDESSSIGGLGSLLGSFGGLLGGASEYNLDKVLEISKSDRIAEKILLKKTTVKEHSDYIANHLIESKDSIGEWISVSWYKRPFVNYERKLKQRQHRFSRDSVDYSNKIETYILKEIIKLLFGQDKSAGNGLIKSEYGELTGIMKVSTSTHSQELSLFITNSIFEELREFYISKSIEKQKQTYDIMKMKHDSISNLLAQKEYSLAKFRDTNQGLFRTRDQVKRDQYQREVFILATALGEAKKNLEITDFALRDKTPFIQVLDRPFLPLNSSKSGIFNMLIFGSILGGFLGFIIVLFRKIYSDIMV